MKTIDEAIEFAYNLTKTSSYSCNWAILSTLEYVYGIPYAELAAKLREHEKAAHRAANEARRLANEARRLANKNI